MDLSVLDQSMIVAGRSPAEAIRETVALARICETMGYRRFWVSEHHGSPGIAGSAPEVLLGAIAVATRRIRIGSAGVMLPHYAPLKVAEQFRVLDALAPGRVDLGLGRGPGADRQTAYALKPAALDNPMAMFAMDTFPTDVADTIAWATGEGPDDGSPFAGVVAQPRGMPGGTTAPEPWIVGSTVYTARLAGELGLPYCIAHFFDDGAGTAEAVEAYRSAFLPSIRLDAPHLALCVWALAAPTETEAEALFEPYAQWRLGRDRGRAMPFPDGPTPARAGAGDAQAIAAIRAKAMFGTPDRVAAALEALQARFAAQEMVVLTTTHDASLRRRSYALIAEATGLGWPAAGTPTRSPDCIAAAPGGKLPERPTADALRS